MADSPATFIDEIRSQTVPGTTFPARTFAPRFGVYGHDGQLGQVSPAIIRSVQEALQREAELQGSTEAFFETGTITTEMCAALRRWGGNPRDDDLRVLMLSWGQELSNACADAGFGPAPRPGASANYPWGIKTDATEALQNEINRELSARGLCTLPIVDGRLGSQTCEAGRYVAETLGVQVPGWSEARLTCAVPPSPFQPFTSNWRPNAPCVGQVIVTPPIMVTCREGEVLNPDTGLCEPMAPPAAVPAARAGGGGGGLAALAILGALVAGYFVLQT